MTPRLLLPAKSCQATGTRTMWSWVISLGRRAQLVPLDLPERRAPGRQDQPESPDQRAPAAVLRGQRGQLAEQVGQALRARVVMTAKTDSTARKAIPGQREQPVGLVRLAPDQRAALGLQVQAAAIRVRLGTQAERGSPETLAERAQTAKPGAQALREGQVALAAPATMGSTARTVLRGLRGSPAAQAIRAALVRLGIPAERVRQAGLARLVKPALAALAVREQPERPVLRETQGTTASTVKTAQRVPRARQAVLEAQARLASRVVQAGRVKPGPVTLEEPVRQARRASQETPATTASTGCKARPAQPAKLVRQVEPVRPGQPVQTCSRSKCSSRAARASSAPARSRKASSVARGTAR